MTKSLTIPTFENEKPSHFADRIGVLYANQVTTSHKKENGQFFTPVEIAHFMGGLIPSCKKESLRVLDPGCGTCILSISLIESLVLKDNRKTLKQIELTAYETDNDILPYTATAIAYLKVWLQEKGVRLTASLLSKDFILDNKDCFKNTNSLFSSETQIQYDIVISNPPYFKLSKDDKRAIAAKSIVWGQPNIYAIFLMAATRLLNQEGELIFIVPRSFTAGNYFRAFREAFFSELKIEQIHLFNSRTETFSRDSVLQETLILRGRKTLVLGSHYNILLSHSSGIRDLTQPSEKTYAADQLIDFTSREKILHLPANETEGRIIELFKSWKGSLNKYGLQISTGPVVSFRAKEWLHETTASANKNLVPLFQLINTGKMSFVHPVNKKSKPQFIECAEATMPLLLPNKNYILLRRFSAKDDKSRLVATPYFRNASKSDFIGIENHLNYIYRPKGLLEESEMLGVSALLNSTLFDTYFRTFNGNINVSATELREMPLPPLEEIQEIGNRLLTTKEISQNVIDDIVNDQFELENILEYAETS